MFDNARIYNLPGSQVYIDADEMQAAMHQVGVLLVLLLVL